MYFPAFFPGVRPFDGRTGGGAVELPVMNGREREIPLDLSIKAVRPPPDSSAADAEDFLLLEHRKLMGGFAGLPRSPSALLDPSLFRLPYRVDGGAPCPAFCAAATSHPMMSALLQRERYLSAEAVNRNPTAPFLDPSALSLHLRSQRETVTRNLYASALPGYPLFAASDYLPPTAEPRRPDEKGAFTSVRTGDKAFLTGTALDAARYAEHLQQLRDHHQQVKCTAACCVSIPGLPQTHTPSSCACCLQNPSPLCTGGRATSLKEAKVCAGILMPPALPLGLQPSPRVPFCGTDPIHPLYVPSAMWNPGLQPPTSLSNKIATPVCSPASDKKKKENGVASPRTAKDYPGKLFVPVPKTGELTAKVKDDNEVIIIDDLSPPTTVSHKSSESSKRSSADPEPHLSKMPRLESFRHSVVEVLADSRCPTGPPPLLPAVPKVEVFVPSDEPCEPKKASQPNDLGSVPSSLSPALGETGSEAPNQPASDEDNKAALKNLLTCDLGHRASPVKVNKVGRGQGVSKCQAKANEDPAVADRRQKAFDLYSDLSELDQQDHSSRTAVRFREAESEVKPIKIKQEVTNYKEEIVAEHVEDVDGRDETLPQCRTISRLCVEENSGGESDATATSEKPVERRILSQLNLTWRQRRLLYTVRRRRFRSGMDMINSRRNHRRKTLPKIKMLPEDDEVWSSESASSGSGLGPPETKRLMANKALGETSLHRAARQCYPDVVLYCLESNACDVNARDNARYTPLHECCSRGHLEIARLLLQYGADVNASAAGGIRPLHDAVENDHVEVVRLLLSYGADPTIATYSGLSPLKLARSPLMSQFLRGFMTDTSGESDGGPVLPWLFHGSASCLDPVESGFDVFDGVPSDSESEGEPAGFLFEVSATPHLPTFRLPLPSSGSKAPCNCLRLADVLRQTNLTKEEFRQKFSHIEVTEVTRQEFDDGATCSQLLTGTKRAGRSEPPTVDIVRLDNHIRAVLGIETVTLR